MPSFFAAISPIGRITASWAISMLDFGFLWCSSPRATPPCSLRDPPVLTPPAEPAQPSSTSDQVKGLVVRVLVELHGAGWPMEIHLLLAWFSRRVGLIWHQRFDLLVVGFYGSNAAL